MINSWLDVKTDSEERTVVIDDSCIVIFESAVSEADESLDDDEVDVGVAVVVSNLVDEEVSELEVVDELDVDVDEDDVVVDEDDDEEEVEVEVEEELEDSASKAEFISASRMTWK